VVVALLWLLTSTLVFALDAPALNAKTQNTAVNIGWTAVAGAERYVLYYAPYPDMDYIGQIDMGEQRELKAELWEGASYYVAVKAYGADIESDFSNIEYFVIPSSRVAAFYYPWYGNPSVDGHWVHWNQNINLFFNPPLDISSDYYPVLGPYSSADPGVVSQHFAWLRDSKVGVIITSWQGQGTREDQLVPLLLDIGQKYNIKVAFHIEPYQERNRLTLIRDISYIYSKYGSHPAFFRSNVTTPYSRVDKAKGVFFMWAADFLNMEDLSSGTRVPLGYWKEAIDAIHESSEGALIIGNALDPKRINNDHFDGLYNYATFNVDVGEEFVWARSLPKDTLYVPSVVPGFSAKRIAYPESTYFPRRNGAAYDEQWTLALGTYVEPFMVTITSFNEWHEGSQIEPAVDGMTNGMGYKYKSYGKLGPEGYLNLTRKWIDKYLNWEWPEVCKLRIIISTTSDWTTVELLEGGAFIKPEKISQSSWLTEGEFDGKKFRMIQPLELAESGKNATIAYDVSLGFLDVEGSLSFEVERGHLGWTKVEIEDREGNLLKELEWGGINETSTRNVTVFEVPIFALLASE